MCAILQFMHIIADLVDLESLASLSLHVYSLFLRYIPAQVAIVCILLQRALDRRQFFEIQIRANLLQKLLSTLHFISCSHKIFIDLILAAVWIGFSPGASVCHH